MNLLPLQILHWKYAGIHIERLVHFMNKESKLWNASFCSAVCKLDPTGDWLLGI